MAESSSRISSPRGQSDHMRLARAFGNLDLGDNTELNSSRTLMGLPTEIRLRIWECVLGGRCIHINYWYTHGREGDVFSDRILKSAVSFCAECSGPKELKKSFESLPYQQIPNDDLIHVDNTLRYHHNISNCLVCLVGPNEHRFKGDIMSLLLVNKTVNSEATPILYSTNRFSLMSDVWTMFDDTHINIFLMKRTQRQKACLKSLSFVMPYVYLGNSDLHCPNMLYTALTRHNLKDFTSLRDVSIFLVREEDVGARSQVVIARRPRVEKCLQVFQTLQLDSFNVVMGGTRGGTSVADNFRHPERVEFARKLERMVLERETDK